MTDRELMQQALDALEEINKLSIGENAICLPAEIDGALDALRERLAQPEQEPVAWRWKERINGDFDSWVVTSSEPPPHAIEKQPLYTAPPRQPWVGLTDEEIDKTHETQVWDARRSYARAIEAKLKEKNT
jgi:hypothetical protein